MNRVFVLSSLGEGLMPCHPARARELLNKGKAVVVKRYPFTIKLLNRDKGFTSQLELKIDPGSKVTGIALVLKCNKILKVIFGMNLHHRGHEISRLLDSRRMVRRSRRNRKTRYRKPRFLNRVKSKHKGWLSPSIMSRIDNTLQWVYRLMKSTQITSIAYERVRFDLNLPEFHVNRNLDYIPFSKTEYEVKEYLLLKYNYQCVYCGAKNVVFEKDHVIARSRGGSNRISNLVLACVKCNQAKSNKPIEDFVKDKTKLAKILPGIKKPLKDAAAVNVTRFKLGEYLKAIGLPINYGTGGMTKYNRTKQGYAKDHWIDAACVGISGRDICIPKTIKPLIVTKQRRNNRQMTLMNKYGFPRTKAKGSKTAFGFRSGDIVKATIAAGKYSGNYLGKVSIRSSGYFDITSGEGDKVTTKYTNIKHVHRFDGYSYNQ